MNMVKFIGRGANARPPLPNEVCHDHMTHTKDRAEDAAIAALWLSLVLAPRLGRSSC